MELKKLENVKVKCDFVGCGNMADYSIDIKRSIFSGTTDICEKCLRELYSLCGHYLTPQSPPNMLRKRGEKNER